MAKAALLTDNFNDSTPDTTKWTVFGPGVSEVNQHVEIRPPGNQSGIFSGYLARTAVDLTGSFIQLEVVQTLRLTSGVQTFFSAGADDFNRLLMGVFGAELRAGYVSGGAFTQLVTLAYDSFLHRWWRLRDTNDTTYWETSPDGEQWTVLVDRPRPVALNAAFPKFGTGVQTAVPCPGLAIFDSFNVPTTSLRRRVEERRLSALQVRERAAKLAERRPPAAHFNNNDEVNHPDWPFIGNHSKSLRHNEWGEPDPHSYGSLLRALQSRDPGDFEEILQPVGAKKFTNPQSGLAFDLEGPDAQAVTQSPAPRFDSAQTAAEMGELYWMALARDVAFVDYELDGRIQQAIQSLNTEFPTFGGTAPVTTQNVFRGIYPGEQAGPYVSQFLLKGNIDPRKQDGQGRDADEGYVLFGSQVIDQRQYTVRGSQDLPPGQSADYLHDYPTWLGAQNGQDFRGQDQVDGSVRRFIRNLRDGANYVHFDQVLNAWWTAAFYLLSEPRGNQGQGNIPGTGRPQVDLEFPLNPGNPYDPPGTAGDSRNQVGFNTFGPIHLLQALVEVAGRAGRAVWWQKWGVHRRLRPEEYGGRVHNRIFENRMYPLHPSIIDSMTSGGLASVFPLAYGSYLLPQAYPEGSPTHPAYGAGHATLSGACATMLKAFFDESTSIENPVVASADGLSLLPYTGTDAGTLTVGGELNKLAGNIALFRNAAGVHWRSDYTESLPLGEAVALGLLQEMSLTFNEDDAFFQLTRFDGTVVRIHDGIIRPVL